MKTFVRFVIAAGVVCGAAALAPTSASAMPAARIATDAAPEIDKAHAVRVCDRRGRCWWTQAGHAHGWRGGYGWGGGGWHGGRRGWHGGRYGWHGHRGGWHGHRGHWR